MKSSQKLSILLWKKMSKQREADGKIPIYAKITVERGGSKEISTGIWLLPENWDVERKLAGLSEKEIIENPRPWQQICHVAGNKSPQTYREVYRWYSLSSKK